MKPLFEITCPSCGKSGVASEENILAGVECPSCQQKFVPAAPTWWEKQKANSPFLQWGWFIVLLALIGMMLASVSYIVLFAFAVIVILAFIAVQVYKIANKAQK